MSFQRIIAGFLVSVLYLTGCSNAEFGTSPEDSTAEFPIEIDVPLRAVPGSYVEDFGSGGFFPLEVENLDTFHYGIAENGEIMTASSGDENAMIDVVLGRVDTWGETQTTKRYSALGTIPMVKDIHLFEDGRKLLLVEVWINLESQFFLRMFDVNGVGSQPVELPNFFGNQFREISENRLLIMGKIDSRRFGYVLIDLDDENDSLTVQMKELDVQPSSNESMLFLNGFGYDDGVGFAGIGGSFSNPTGYVVKFDIETGAVDQNFAEGAIFLQIDGLYIERAFFGLKSLRVFRKKIYVLGPRGLLRFDLNGIRDESFNSPDELLERGNDRFWFSVSMTIQPDGKIITSGVWNAIFVTTQERIQFDEIGIRRYHPDGSIDESFGISISKTLMKASYIRNLKIDWPRRRLITAVRDSELGWGFIALHL